MTEKPFKEEEESHILITNRVLYDGKPLLSDDIVRILNIQHQLIKVMYGNSGLPKEYMDKILSGWL